MPPLPKAEDVMDRHGVVLRLFGAVVADANGEDVLDLLRKNSVEAPDKTLLLLATLALIPDKAWSAEELGSLLWPGSDNSRQIVSKYRCWLAKVLSTANGSSIDYGDLLKLQGVWVDLWEFEQVCRERRQETPKHAIELYKRGTLFGDRDLSRLPDLNELVARRRADLDIAFSRLKTPSNTPPDAPSKSPSRSRSPSHQLQWKPIIACLSALVFAAILVIVLYAWPRSVRADQMHQSEAARHHYNLGNACRHNGRFVPAVEEFAEAVRLQPDWIEAIEDEAEVYAFNIRTIPAQKKAMQLFGQILEMQPGYDKARRNRDVVRHMLDWRYPTNL